MNCRDFVAADGSRVVSLFGQVFSAAEGPEEGAAVASLVQSLINARGGDVQGFVADAGDDLQAAIFFSRLRFEGSTPAWLLSPVAVATDCQGQGIGQRLIRHGLAALADQGVALVVTYGDPAFYGRFGFKVISEDVISAPFSLSQPEGWQCLSLNDAPVCPQAGLAQCIPAFDDPSLW